MANRNASEVAPKPLVGRRDSCVAATLAVLVLVSQLLFRGPVYFADGPSLVEAIVDKIYVIQPPGYWLLCRIAGLFPDPGAAIGAMNIFFPVAGVVAFYYTARFFAEAWSAFAAGLAYASIFYIWFSGEIHSSYASQILFPVATFYALLRYDRDRANWTLWAAAALFSLGAGLRPSDGAFVGPMVVYYAFSRMPRWARLPFFSLIAVLCLGWVVPTILAYRGIDSGPESPGQYVQRIVSVKSILFGVNPYSLANSARYAIPLLVALWPVLATAVLNGVKNRDEWRTRLMLLWIVPGSLFFVLILITDPTYLDFLSAAIVLLAVKAPRRMLATAVWNAVLFIGMQPIPSHRLVAEVVNSYIVPYTRYGLEHRDWTPRLSEMVNGGK